MIHPFKMANFLGNFAIAREGAFFKKEQVGGYISPKSILWRFRRQIFNAMYNTLRIKALFLKTPEIDHHHVLFHWKTASEAMKFVFDVVGL